MNRIIAALIMGSVIGGAQAAHYEIEGLSIDASHEIVVNVSKNKINHNSYSFFETVVSVSPKKGVVVLPDMPYDSSASRHEFDYSVNVRNLPGYAMSGIAVSAGRHGTTFGGEHEDGWAEASGSYTHAVNGQVAYLDTGTLAPWAECDYYCIMPYDLSPFQYEADHSAMNSMQHEFTVALSGSFRDVIYGRAPTAFFIVPSMTFRLYSPGDLAAVAPVPEPETYALTALGLTVLLVRRRQLKGGQCSEKIAS
ncbi:PEP-CTERM sorting domain-containing protein [Chitinibacteraceae bacterium HSL-7]